MDEISENEISVPMSLYFDRSSAPTLQEVIDSLQGFDAIAKRFPKILSELMDVPVSSVSVNVNKIEIGSLYDDLIVNFGFGGQEQIDLFMKEMHEEFMNHEAVPYLIFFLLLIAGGVVLYKAVSPKEKPMDPIINSHNTTIVNIIAADVGKDPEQVKEIIERAVPHSESIKLAKDSCKIFNAFGDSESMKFKNFEKYSMPKELVKSFPSDIAVDEIEDMKDFDGVEVQIRAADMDSLKTGWAARIPAVYDKRLKVKVAGAVDASKINMGASVKADVTVVYKNEGGEMVPSYAMIRKIY